MRRLVGPSWWVRIVRRRGESLMMTRHLFQGPWTLPSDSSVAQQYKEKAGNCVRKCVCMIVSVCVWLWVWVCVWLCVCVCVCWKYIDVKYVGGWEREMLVCVCVSVCARAYDAKKWQAKCCTRKLSNYWNRFRKIFFVSGQVWIYSSLLESRLLLMLKQADEVWSSENDGKIIIQYFWRI